MFYLYEWIEMKPFLGEEMTYEVQTWDDADKTVYYETVKDANDYESARDIIVEKYPNRKVIAVIRK